MRKQKTKLPSSFKVTQDNIDRGERRSVCNCPIALALREAGIVAEVRNRGYINAGKVKGVVDPVAQSFIISFDNYGPGMVQPFEFGIDWEK